MITSSVLFLPSAEGEATIRALTTAAHDRNVTDLEAAARSFVLATVPAPAAPRQQADADMSRPANQVRSCLDGWEE